MPNFIAFEKYFIFETKFYWNDGIDTCFNVECLILGFDYDCFRGFLVVNARYLVVTGGYFNQMRIQNPAKHLELLAKIING